MAGGMSSDLQFDSYVIGRLACSKRSDSGERCGVEKAMKSRGGLSSSLAFTFSRSLLLCTAPHYLNAWNRLLAVANLVFYGHFIC